jgi:hypothetical protein
VPLTLTSPILVKNPELFILIELILDVIFEDDITVPPINNFLFLSVFKPILIFPDVNKSPLKFIFSTPDCVKLFLINILLVVILELTIK